MSCVSPGRHLGGLSPEWRALWPRIPTRALRALLSRLAHACSLEGVAPGAVDDAVMARFGAGL